MIDSLAKFEKIPQLNTDPSDQLFLEAEKLSAYFKQEYEKFKLNFQENQENKERESLVENELSVIINKFTNIILTESDEEKVKKAVQMLVQFFSQAYFNVGSAVFRKLHGLMDQSYVAKWGVDFDGNEDKNKEIENSQEKNKKEVDYTDQVNIIFKEIFKFYNLDPKIMFSAWRESIIPDKKDEYQKMHGLRPSEQRSFIMNNLSSLVDLEMDRPGASSALMKEFGIVNFGRYPRHLLCDQYDNKDNQDKPYGVVIDAWQDYNGSSYGRRELFDKLYFNLALDLQGKYALRFMEAGGRFSVMRDLVSLDKHYGQNQKISFALIYAHGNEKTMSFGDWSDDRPGANIQSSDLPLTDWLQKVRKFFSSDSTIILDSCLTGAKDGLAQDVAKKLKIKVLASDKACGGISSIKLKEKDGHLDFKIKFYTDPPFLLKKITNSQRERKAREFKPVI